MKMMCVFALLLMAMPSRADPIQKIIELITEFQGKIIRDGEVEQKAYEEYFEWCDDASKEKEFEVKTATDKKAKLEATIKKAASDIDDYTEKIAELAKSIATDEKDLEDATVIREKEHKDFVAAEAELMESIDMLARAAGIIEREMKGSALMQTQVDTSNLQGLIGALRTIIDATSMQTNDKQRLMALVQSNQVSEDDDAEFGAPDPAVYKSKSGGIVDVLNDMKEQAEGELSELRKAETNTKHNYDMLKQSLTDSIAAAEHEKKEAAADMAEAEETKAVAEGELVVTNKDLAIAVEALDLIHEDCMQKAADHEITVKGRKEELASLGKAKKILQTLSSLQVSQSPSFLQTASTSRMRTGVDLANAEVVNLVKKLAIQQHSAALAQLASRIQTLIRYSSRTGDDPFAKVKGLITEMIAKLMKEAEAEASEKAYCDEEMGKTKAKKDELSGDIEKLTAKIDKATSASIALKEDVKELQKELAELEESQAEMDKIRTDTHAAYEEAKADLEKGLEAVRMALEVLRDYYGSKEEALLQDNSRFDAFMQQPAAPEKHEKSSGAGGGIISMLEVAESDFAKNLAEEESEEAAAQEEYEKVTQENKVTKTVKTQDVKYKTKEFTALDKEVAELSADRDGAQTELDAVLEYYEKIKDRCIAKPEPYEERKRRREAEIAGLKEALSILEGQAFFLQRHTGLRSIRTH
eukprot:gnl/MRDRNA2_/MRDRNA2_82704_c0_seq3.p1 gnl/MRDRNA2_/MRDRNA2_82704_c0~~gnl/MRDRNA2_/MRDRNA2_82704_c0_seq3.p1  ORF type:complete len:699 (+),score=234.66 gnl/MRDRNA2_/MRDRNA2_82704_c0_seq3:64-2160(+)